MLDDVLNALRHQWFGRIKRLKEEMDAVNVLNALRHQWFGRSRQGLRIGPSLLCSTPCGISGLAGCKSLWR